jgi:hypothetical protein
MTGLDPSRESAENYRAFARLEAAGRSPAYEVLANAVAGDDVVLDFLSALPALKRQPNLLFAAARSLLEDVPDIRGLRDLVRQRGADLSAVILARRTQTNEVGRCATLLPALARLPGPLALIEVGASAGLALLMDRYSYDYDGHVLHGSGGAGPLLHCHAEGGVPIPDRVPRVVWRAGLDLNPLDVMDDDDVAWLQCLVWPGQVEREERLLAAIEVARSDPPEVTRGDLLVDLPALVAQAPGDSTVVVFHSAVLAYVDLPKRRAFADLIHDLGVQWLSNEDARVLPNIDLPTHDGAPFVLVENGSKAVAFTHPHGDWIRWLD